MAGRRWGGRRATRLLQLVLSVHGPYCCLCHGAIVLDRDDPTFARLGPSVEHLLPRSRGGSDDLSNLRPAHRSCNSSRGNRMTPRPAVVDSRAFFKTELR